MNDPDFYCNRPDCGKFFDLNDRFPYISPQYFRVCKECVDNQQLSGYTLSDNTFIARLGQELIYPDCHSSPCHPNNDHRITCDQAIQALYFNTVTLKVLCSKCSGNDPAIVRLDRKGAKYYLLTLLEQVKDWKEYPREYYEEFQSLKFNKEEAKKILMFLKKKFLFDTDQLLCFDHLSPAEFIDRNSYKHKCKICRNENCCELNDENRLKLYNRAFELLRDAKTSSFRSFILEFMKKKSFDNGDYKNFFNEFSYMLPEMDLPLCSSSRCLICQEILNIGPKYPISIHQEEKHEICYECYIKSPNKICPIDHQPFSISMILTTWKFLFEVKPKSCCHDHATQDGRFSYYLDSPPYMLACPHLCCKKCKESNVTSNFYSCPQCNHAIKNRPMLINQYIYTKIHYLESFCYEHPNQLVKYHNINELIPYCDKCKPPPKYRIDQTEKFWLGLITKIFTHQDTSPILQKIKENYLLLPISHLYRCYRYFTRNTPPEPIMRFDDIFPLHINSRNYWVYQQNHETLLTIKSNSMFLLSGIIMGRVCQQACLFQISCEGMVLFYGETSVLQEITCKDFKVPFDRPICVDREIKLKFHFSPGFYCHGRHSKKKLEFHRDVTFSFETNNRVNGDMAIGGPVLGLIIENVFYAYDLK